MIKTKIIKIQVENLDVKVIRTVAKEMKKGKIVVYPTETCYGLGTNALNKEAVDRIYEIKGRPKKSDIIVIVPDLKLAKKYSYITPIAEKLAKEFMPGPLTLIVKRKKTYPLITNRAFAFRISSNKVAHLLSKYAKVPITATSANIHGNPSLYSGKEVIRCFNGKVDIILDGGKLKKVKPSTIVDLKDGKPRIIRKGPIPFRRVLEALKV